MIACSLRLRWWVLTHLFYVNYFIDAVAHTCSLQDPGSSSLLSWPSRLSPRLPRHYTRCLQLSIIDANNPDFPSDYFSFSWSYVPPWYIPSPPLKRGQHFAGVGGIDWTFILGHALVWFVGGFLWNFFGLAPKGVPKMVSWQMLHLSSKDLSCLMTNSVTGKWDDE